jgi:hypothetical protein
VNRPSMTGPWRTVEVLTVFGERDATIAATEQRAGAGAVLQAMIIDESLTVSEAVQWCAGAATAELPGLVR